MTNLSSISKSDLAQLDKKIDYDIAGLNNLLDRVLDKTPGYSVQKSYANSSSNQASNQPTQSGYDQQSAAIPKPQPSKDNGQNGQVLNSGTKAQDQSNISYTQFVQGTKSEDPNNQYQFSTPVQGQGYNDYSGFLKPNQIGEPGDYTSFLKSPDNESISKLNVNEEEVENGEEKDRIQFLVRESVRPSDAKLIDFGEVRNGAEILQELENKENRDTTQLERDDIGTTRKVTKRRRRKSVTPIIDETLEQVEKDMNYMNKFTTDQILKTLDQSEEGQLYLIDSIRRAHKPTRKNKKNPEEEVKKIDPIDEILINPSDADIPGKLVTIYQQVSEVYEDGTKYEGEKFMGKRHGKGTYYYQEGYKYEGSWEEDQMCGFGILWINEDTKWYEGDWHDNMFHGRGILYNLNPEELVGEQFFGENFNNLGNGWGRYEGQFHKGVKQGFGCLFLTNGDQHVGNFNEDSVHGRGSYTRPGGFVIAGLWENGEIKIAF